MPTNYTIYLVNNSVSTQTFWAFLAPPVVTQSPTLFANSNTSLQIPGLSTNLNSFTIPVQYVVGAGASNNAVGLNTVITSNATRNTDLNQGWQVTYATVPPNAGPIMPATASGTSGPTSIGMTTNPFDQQINQANNWHENMTFGIRTSSGSMGVTWTPNPSTVYTITPTLTFYIAVGSFMSNQLASISAISTGTQALPTPSAFNAVGVCTVLYSSKGIFSTYAGPPAPDELLSNANAVSQFLEMRGMARDQVIAGGTANYGANIVQGDMIVNSPILAPGPNTVHVTLGGVVQAPHVLAPGDHYTVPVNNASISVNNFAGAATLVLMYN
jgi:hypothetical protein